MAEKTGTHCEVTYEVFSLPVSVAATLKRENLGGVKMHAHLIEQVALKKVTQEKFLMFHVIEGSSGLTSEIEEFIFPGEYEPDRLAPGPDPVPYRAPLIPIPLVSPVYATKNMGNTVETSIRKTEEGLLLDIRATHVSLFGIDTYGTGVSSISYPRFGVQKIKASSRASIGKPFLLGTVSPKASQIEKPPEKQIRLAWATITLSKK